MMKLVERILVGAMALCVVIICVAIWRGPRRVQAQGLIGYGLATAMCPTGYTCFYIAAGGSDSATGADSAHPWQTVSKAMTVVNQTQTSPHAVLFNQGDTWTAQEFDISNAIGMCAANDGHGNCTSGFYPTIIGTYGTGPRPIFDENNVNNHCFAANATTAKWITLGYGVGFECEHAKYSGVNLLIGSDGETSTTPGLPGFTVENMYVHNTGNGCSNTNGRCLGSDTTGCSVNSCNYDYDNQINFVSVATCNNTTNGCAGDSVKFLNNIVRYVGGHNCMQVHGDYGQPIIAGNISGPGCPHENIDVKAVGWSNASTPGSRTALIHDNIADVGISTAYGPSGQACYIILGAYDFNNSAEWYNNICYDSALGFEVAGFDQAQGNGSGGSGCAGGPNCNTHAFIYNNTMYANGRSAQGLFGPWAGVGGSTTLNGGIASGATSLIVNTSTNFVPTAGFASPFIVKIDSEFILVGAVSGSSGSWLTWSSLTRGYLGTTAASHSTGATVNGGAYGTGYIDARNNIWDRSNFNYLATTEPGVILAENYNDCGGAQGKPTGAAPTGGSWTCSGANDLSNVDPLYVSANLNPPDNAAPPNFRVQNTQLIGKGQFGLTPGNNSIGALR